MRFALSAEQSMISEIVQKLAARHHALDIARAPDKSARQAVWEALVNEAGAHSLLLPDNVGGADASFVDVAAVLEGLGRGLAATPILGSSVLTTSILASISTPAARTACARLAEGSVISLGLRDSAGPAVTVEDGSDYRLSGIKTMVLDTTLAQAFLVTTSVGDSGGLGLFLVEAEAEGVTVEPLPSLDRSRDLGQVSFERSPAALISFEPGTPDIVHHALDLGRLALAAEQLGAAQTCLDSAVDHAAHRVQFGRPIGGFQAVKHRLADMLVSVESTRAVVYHGAWAADAGEPDLPTTSTIAGSVAARALYQVAASNIQVQGAIAYTWEHDAHLYYKRAVSSRALFDDPRDRGLRLWELKRAHTEEPRR